MFSKIRRKHIDKWAGGYAIHLVRSALAHRPSGLRHLLFAVCDHYEPLWNRPPGDVAEARVGQWVRGYPILAQAYRDSDNRPPQHSFFFPGEEYRPTFFDGIETLVRSGYGEVELHLHHDNATAADFLRDLECYTALFASRGHFARDPDGKSRYAFIHGNWALANSRPDGRYCGVDQELPILFSTGCYADFTFPSVPDVSQPNIVNQIYWPTGDLARRRAFASGRRARTGEEFTDRLLMIQGPLAVTRRGRSWAGRIEYGALTARDPVTPERVRAWVSQNIHVVGRPEWVFVKVYTHGAPEAQAAALLGASGHAMHRELTTTYNDGINWKLHYVTAREMYNIAIAAMRGKTGDPGLYRNLELPVPPIVAEARPHRSAA